MDLYHIVTRDLDRSAALPYLAGQRVLVAVSGGADSLGLLHVLRRLQPALGMTLAVATLDHGLRGAAGEADADFVASLAADWALPVWRAWVDVPALAAQHRLGIEEAARRARYTFLAAAAQEFSAATIATGHQADDQAETILMHLVRGTGLAGLRGMQPFSPLSAQHLLPGETLPPSDLMLVRPLLGVSRAQIEMYCVQQGLQPRVDATNAEPLMLRNRIRHEVLPLLETLNPEIRVILARTGKLLAYDYANLQQQAEATLTRLLRNHAAERLQLDLAAFRALDPGLQRWVLRQALHTLRGTVQDTGLATLDAAAGIAREGTTGQQATLPGGILLRVGYITLDLEQPGAPLPPAPDWPRLPAGISLPVQYPGCTPLPGGDWQLVTRWLTPSEDPTAFYGQPFSATLALPANASLALRTRQPGDRLAPLGMGGKTQKIKDILINARIPAALRDELPILTINGTLAWLAAGPHSRIAARFSTGSTHNAVLWLYYTQG